MSTRLPLSAPRRARSGLLWSSGGPILHCLARDGNPRRTPGAKKTAPRRAPFPDGDDRLFLLFVLFHVVLLHFILLHFILLRLRRHRGRGGGGRGFALLRLSGDLHPQWHELAVLHPVQPDRPVLWCSLLPQL